MKQTFTDPIVGITRTVETDAPSSSLFKEDCNKSGVPVAVAAAIINHESRWKAFSTLGPTIAWNGSVFASKFSKYTNFKVTITALNADLDMTISDPILRGQKQAWASIVKAVSTYGMPALKIALESTAFGLGQVMGFNYEKVGYATVLDMYAAMWNTRKQTDAMIKYCSQIRLKQAMILQQWDDISRLYAGAKWEDYAPDFSSYVMTKTPLYEDYFADIITNTVDTVSTSSQAAVIEGTINDIQKKMKDAYIQKVSPIVKEAKKILPADKQKFLDEANEKAISFDLFNPSTW